MRELEAVELRMCIEGAVVPMKSYPKPPKIDRVGNRVLVGEKELGRVPNSFRRFALGATSEL